MDRPIVDVSKIINAIEATMDESHAHLDLQTGEVVELSGEDLVPPRTTSARPTRRTGRRTRSSRPGRSSTTRRNGSWNCRFNAMMLTPSDDRFEACSIPCIQQLGGY